jgi:hypothetical protein
VLLKLRRTYSLGQSISSLEIKMSLPDPNFEAWEPDTQAKLGGLMQMAGIDPVEAFMPRAVKDHPWIGLEIEFSFPEVCRGKITRCIIHPRGKLMFDVEFPEPVPPIHGLAPNFHVVLKDNPDYHQTVHRFFGHELRAMIV